MWVLPYAMSRSLVGQIKSGLSGPRFFAALA